MSLFGARQRKLSLLMGAAPIGMLLATGAPSLAQDETASGERPEVIIVRGFRGSLSASLDVKRESAGVVDAILAEDIADFPDLNLAESLQRIPGVAIDRVNGEGRRITVRGLPAQFNRIRINGMEAMNTTGSTDSSGGSNRSRGFDFNTFSSDLFNQIIVRKTASADVEEGALGATVDLRTARPFDFGEGLTMSGSAQMGWNDLSEEWSPRVAALISHTDPSERIGFLVSFAYSDRSIVEEGFSSVRWDDGNFRSVLGVDCGANPADPGCASVNSSSLTYTPRIPRYGRLTHEQERLGVTGSLQFRPTNRTEISFDALYSQFNATRDEEFLELFIRSQQQFIDITQLTIDPSRNIVDSATLNISPVGNGTHPIRSEHRFDELETDFTQFTFNITHEFTDRLRGGALAGMVDSNHSVPRQTTILFDAVAPVTGYSYDFRGDLQTPAISYGSLNVTDPTQWAFTEFRDRPQTVDNSYDHVSAFLEYDVNDRFSLSGGVSWREFGFASTEFRRESTFGSRLCDSGVYDCDLDNDGTDDIPGAPLTGNLVGTLTGFGSGLGLPAGTPTSWVSANVDAAAQLINLYSIPGAPQAGNIRSVTESDLGFWTQADFEFMLGSIPVRGDVGVRYVETEVTSTGQVGGVDVTLDNRYTDTLPSANLVFELREDFLVRAGVARIMARPALGNLTPGGSLDSFSGEPYSYDAGNPGLDPFRATSFDLSFEWYFADEALFAVGLFYKDVDSFFTSGGSTIIPFSATGLPVSLAPASSPLRVALDAGGDPTVEVSQVQNGGDAALQGIELVYQQPFTFLPGALSNFGFLGNYTYVDSDEIIGFSPNSFNATLYYEDERFSARISGAYRDAYVTTAANGAGRNERGVDATFNLDFASSYRLNENVEFTFEAINLTDEFEHQLYDQADLPTVYHHTGTEYLVGVRLRN